MPITPFTLLVVCMLRRDITVPTDLTSTVFLTTNLCQEVHLASALQLVSSGAGSEQGCTCHLYYLAAPFQKNGGGGSGPIRAWEMPGLGPVR